MCDIFGNKTTQDFYVVTNTLYRLGNLLAGSLPFMLADGRLGRLILEALGSPWDKKWATAALPSIVASWRCEMEGTEHFLHLCVHQGHVSVATSWGEPGSHSEDLIEASLGNFGDGSDIVAVGKSPVLIQRLSASAMILKDSHILVIPHQPCPEEDPGSKVVEPRAFIV